jgi:plasmid segregation protein ParM
MAESVFGIDHGNGNIKSQSQCIPCGLVRYTTEPGRFMNEDILEYKGMFYTLSESRMPYKSDKTTDSEYFILTLFILALESKSRGISINGKELILGIGVPPADFSQQAGKFRQYFLDEAKGGVSFKWNGADVHFGIKDVQVSPQNFAAVFCYKASLFKQYRTVNCIDIGDGTVDLLVIRKGQPDLSVRVSERLGIAVLRSEIANSIQQNFGLQLDSSDVEQVLLHEPTVLDEKVVEEISRMADEWMVRIINRLHTYVPDFRINPTVFLGGGSQILYEQIKSSPDFKYIEFIDNIKANAVGYAMLVKAKLKRQ